MGVRGGAWKHSTELLGDSLCDIANNMDYLIHAAIYSRNIQWLNDSLCISEN